MTHKTVRGIDIYDFPETDDIAKMLYWMGDNYINYIIDTFTEQLRKQDKLTEIIGIKCENDPVFETQVSATSNKIHTMKAQFLIQLLLKDGTGNHWRLYGMSQHLASDLDTKDPKIITEFRLEKTEKL